MSDRVQIPARIVASTMYGFCVFGVLNLNLPLVFGFKHFDALLIAAAATAGARAVESGPCKTAA